MWNDITSQVPNSLFQGLQAITETDLNSLDNFYASMLCSYSHVNNLFYERNKNKSSSLPVNLWGHPKSHHIFFPMAVSGFCTTGDLPLIQGKIDFGEVQRQLPAGSSSCFLVCYKLQTIFAKHFINETPGSHFVTDEIVAQSKSLLLHNLSKLLSLSNWEKFFHLMPLSRGEKEMVFSQMLYNCKFTKFQEINFKILSHTLLTSIILSIIKKNPTVANCPWCCQFGTLEHCLFECLYVKKAYSLFERDNKRFFGTLV